MYTDDNRSEWLRDNIRLENNNNATFVECLRWMRIPEKTIENQTNQSNVDSKLKLLQQAAQKANNATKQNTFLKKHLEQLNSRTIKIAGENNTFNAICSWRMRVGGQRGAENILLPAFDNIGLPYIPSSTLRGIARNQALLELGNTADVDRYFGSLEADNPNKMGKVIFLDAYPLASQWRGNNISLDIANNIWKWNEGDSNTPPGYSPNPNLFISLKQSTFLIGLRPLSIYLGEFDTIVNWLKKGLQSGVGSQINSGYGSINIRGESNEEPFLEIAFTLQGQLINSYPIANSRNKEPEVRPIAFKSMLRYWFRTIAFGFLPIATVKEWESKLFGSIDSRTKAYGWIKFQITNDRNPAREQNPDRECRRQTGKLKLYLSPKVPQEKQQIITSLFNNLTWLMFHIGGIGQGARRPLYTRNSNPWYRGSKLRITNNVFPPLPDNCEEFQSLFKTKFRNFWDSLATLTEQQINLLFPINSQANEVIDLNCKMFVCQGETNLHKCYALEILHDEETTGIRYDPDLCGGQSNPSPVWIAGLDNYQVVTVFGSNNCRRQMFINRLRQNTDPDRCLQIFPWE